MTGKNQSSLNKFNICKTLMKKLATGIVAIGNSLTLEVI
jgi:hypothetical protein